MFINFVSLMLINLVAGLVLLAYFVYDGLDSPDRQKYTPGFAIVGLIASITGFFMIFTWPLPASYNIAFGETSVMFGLLFLGAALATGLSWHLISVAIYGFIAGLAAIDYGARILSLGLTQAPAAAGAGYILAGLAGVLTIPAALWHSNRLLRLILVAVLLGAAGIFAVTGYAAIWAHLSDYLKWVPFTLRAS